MRDHESHAADQIHAGKMHVIRVQLEKERASSARGIVGIEQIKSRVRHVHSKLSDAFPSGGVMQLAISGAPNGVAPPIGAGPAAPR